jgi:hypothetical protein
VKLEPESHSPTHCAAGEARRRTLSMLVDRRAQSDAEAAVVDAEKDMPSSRGGAAGSRAGPQGRVVSRQHACMHA